MLLSFFSRFSRRRLFQFAVVVGGSIVGGGIANLIDRFRFGHVTDFFHIDLGGVFKTGIFNVADMSVMLGLGLLIFSSFKSKKTT